MVLVRNKKHLKSLLTWEKHLIDSSLVIMNVIGWKGGACTCSFKLCQSHFFFLAPFLSRRTPKNGFKTSLTKKRKREKQHSERSMLVKDKRWNKNPFAISTSIIIHLVCPPKFCITFVSHFSWISQSSQEKLKTMIMQNIWGQTRCIMGDVEMANALNGQRKEKTLLQSFYLIMRIKIKIVRLSSWLSFSFSLYNYCYMHPVAILYSAIKLQWNNEYIRTKRPPWKEYFLQKEGAHRRF